MAMRMNNREERDSKKKSRKPRFPLKKKTCRFCADRKLTIDYKDGKALFPFLTERGRLMPRRITGNCAGHQLEVTLAVKRARIVALIPFTATQA